MYKLNRTQAAVLSVRLASESIESFPEMPQCMKFTQQGPSLMKGHRDISDKYFGLKFFLKEIADFPSE
jgi:hypothetical protein